MSHKPQSLLLPLLLAASVGESLHQAHIQSILDRGATRRRGSRGVQMGAHNAKLCAKRRRANKIAAKSRQRNRCVR